MTSLVSAHVGQTDNGPRWVSAHVGQTDTGPRQVGEVRARMSQLAGYGLSAVDGSRSPSATPLATRAPMSSSTLRQ